MTSKQLLELISKLKRIKDAGSAEALTTEEAEFLLELIEKSWGEIK